MTAPAPPSMFPDAVWLDAGYSGLQSRMPLRACILHTNGGPSSDGSLHGWWQQHAASGSRVGSQYQVRSDGVVECYSPPALVVYHAFEASKFAFGIETQDDSDPTAPWTPAQLAGIAAILRFHGVPPAQLTSLEPAEGVGFHRQFDEWNHNKHVCPGSVREAQIAQLLLMLADPIPVPKTSPEGDDVITIICSPGQHQPRILGDDGKVGAEMGSTSWSAFSDLASLGGAKIVTLHTQDAYDAIVAQGGGK